MVSLAAHPAGAPSHRGRAIRGGTAFAGYLALVLLLFHRAWAAPDRLVVGSAGDSWQAIWFLRWVPYAISHGMNPLFTDHIDYPGGINLMWNTSLPLVGALSWPVSAIFGPVVTYNVVVTLAVALSALAAYAAARRLGVSWTAAFVAGCLYGFSPYMVGHSQGHPNLLIAVAPPIVLVLLHEILARQRARPLLAGALLGLVAGLQFLVGAEVLITTALMAAFGLGYLALLHRRVVGQRLPYAARSLTMAGVVAMLLAIVPLAFAFFGPQHVGDLGYPRLAATDPLGFVVPTSLNLLAPALTDELTRQFPGNLSEWGAFLGLPLIGVVIFQAISRRADPWTKILVLLALTAAVLSLGRRLHVMGTELPVPLPWAVLQRIPILSDVQAPRFSLQVMLCVALVVALFMDQAIRSRPPRRLVTLGLVGLVLLSLVPKPLPGSPTVAPAFFTSGATDMIPQGSVVVVAPFAGIDTRGVSSDAMLWQAVTGMRFKMPEGYALGPRYPGGPPATERAMKTVQTANAPLAIDPLTVAEMSREWDGWRVSFVIVGPMRNREAMLSLVRSVTGQTGTEVNGVFVWDLRR